jgi:hypothetical protein
VSQFQCHIESSPRFCSFIRLSLWLIVVDMV